jgi:hypothetical protein
MIMVLIHTLKRKTIAFIKNEKAVLGLPMRLTVSLIIGTVALAAILSYILNPCLFPARMIVSVNPIVHTISGDDAINMTVYVNETTGHPIKDAIVIIKGLGGAGTNMTDEHGKAIINITVKLQDGQYEGYLDISVKAACHEPFSQQDIIKIVRES